MPRNTHLLIIDPQNDFCDLPAADCSKAATQPALPVPGAHADMQRLARLIDEAGAGLTRISLTLDSHHRLDIAHPGFWHTADSVAPAPFTQISAAQVRAGQYRVRDAAAQARSLAYLDALEARGRYQLMVWPVHCEIGSWGHNVHAAVRAAYNAWEERAQRSVAKWQKGHNPWTEHYSAVLAEVPDAADAHTQLNQDLIDDVSSADVLLIAGEAGSHCVRATTEDLVAHLPAAPRPQIVLLTDCISPVAGFEAQQAAFFEAMQARGVRLARSTEVLAGLQ